MSPSSPTLQSQVEWSGGAACLDELAPGDMFVGWHEREPYVFIAVLGLGDVESGRIAVVPIAHWGVEAPRLDFLFHSIAPEQASSEIVCRLKGQVRVTAFSEAHRPRIHTAPVYAPGQLLITRDGAPAFTAGIVPQRYFDLESGREVTAPRHAVRLHHWALSLWDGDRTLVIFDAPPARRDIARGLGPLDLQNNSES